MMRWGGKMTNRFLEENFHNEEHIFNKNELGILYNVYVNCVSFLGLLLWYGIDFF